MGTAGEWEGERETWEEGLTKSLQQVQSPDCISEGGRGYTREHWAAALSLPVARRQERRLEAGIGSVRQNGLVPDPDDSGERKEGRYPADPAIPVPVADITNQAEGSWQTNRDDTALPLSPDQTSDPWHSLQQPLLTDWG